MVHHEKRYDTLSKAAQEKNGIAVLGILFHVTKEPNAIIEKVLENSKAVFDVAGRNSTYRDKLLLSELLPRNQAKFFRYEGSLTTPSCGEAVVWTVFEQSIAISEDQLERFKSVHDDSGHELTHNYRHIQPLNSRALIYVQGEGFDGSAASAKFISLPLILMTMIFGIIRMKF
jgi:carbonic anhydrase